MKESKNYPLYEVTPVNSIRELLDIAEAEVPEKIAFKYRVKDDIIKEIKYAEFIRDVNAVGSALCELGVVGEHIAQIGENSYRWINVYLTVLAGNGVYIPVDKDSEQYALPTLVPEGIESVPKRFAISFSNNYMVNESDTVVCYITHDWGGAAQFVEKANKKGKVIINLAEANLSQKTY